MGFHCTEATCYLTDDMFYLEVLLLPAGQVQDVKLALSGEAPEVRALGALFCQLDILTQARGLQCFSGHGHCSQGAPHIHTLYKSILHKWLSS